jgi:phosphomannomutase / phosphoglucomutase
VSIYKACDIRGTAGTELTPELYRQWGRTLGQQVEPAAKFVVGGDLRASTPQFLAALSAGLGEAGVDVVELGSLPTPMIYHARHRLQAAACAIVTGSHYPADINGLKWMIGELPPTPEDIELLRRQAETPAPSPSPPLTPHSAGAPRTLDVSFDYVASLQEAWVDALGAQCHVVLDPMHGCCAARARRYLHAIFPQCLFSAIHDTPDAAFAGGTPDCSRPQRLEELCEAVYRQRAHVGIAFDGDGDRLALVDNEGMPLSAEETTWVLLQSFGPQLQAERFVYDVRLSDRIAETAEELGAEPLVERSGHAFLCTRMRQAGALFGAKLSGHYFFRAIQGGDDGLFTACWLIAYLARCRTTLAHLRRECPPIYASPELRLPLSPPQQQDIMERVRAAWANFPRQTIDGLRIETPEGRALVRSSPGEAALNFRFESSDWHALDELVEHFCTSLPEVGPELWIQYEQAMGTSGPCG